MAPPLQADESPCMCSNLSSTPLADCSPARPSQPRFLLNEFHPSPAVDIERADRKGPWRTLKRHLADELRATLLPLLLFADPVMEKRAECLMRPINSTHALQVQSEWTLIAVVLT